jgi:phage-related protein
MSLPITHPEGAVLNAMALNRRDCSQRRGQGTPMPNLWKGLGPGVLELVSNFATNTFRAVYVARFEKAIYVLHCFQKKSPSGIRTANTDVALVEKRLKAAQVDYEVRYGKARK